MMNPQSNATGMARLQINDYESWGKLVKTWATGNNTYLQDGQSYPLPQDVFELNDQMIKAAAGMVPASYLKDTTTLTITVMDDDILYIQLPPKEVIEKVEQDLQNGRPYPLPAFYIGPALDHLPEGPQDCIDFNHARVGEYSVLFCA
jgi:hypothetical protein